MMAAYKYIKSLSPNQIKVPHKEGEHLHNNLAFTRNYKHRPMGDERDGVIWGPSNELNDETGEGSFACAIFYIKEKRTHKD